VPHPHSQEATVLLLSRPSSTIVPENKKNRKDTASTAHQSAQTDGAGKKSTFAAYGDTEASIAQLIEFTGATRQDVIAALEASNGDAHQACADMMMQDVSDFAPSSEDQEDEENDSDVQLRAQVLLIPAIRRTHLSYSFAIAMN
jgi:NACalpha-BTF3-like transcription factor